MGSSNEDEINGQTGEYIYLRFADELNMKLWRTRLKDCPRFWPEPPEEYHLVKWEHAGEDDI